MSTLQLPLNPSTHSNVHYQSTHSRWHALTHRTPSSHSSFLYGVKSTKIYCRPTCTARLARRANVVFYDTAEQAQRDGFRPCKRCQPDNTGFVGEREELVTKVIELVLQRREDRGLKELAAEVGVSPSYLARVFKGCMGVTVGKYVMEFERTIPEQRRYEDQASTGSSLSPSSQTLVEDVGREDFDLDEWFWTEDFLNASLSHRDYNESLS
ncbi:metal binding domain of Ada-domain-containing protein [Aspergillus californicus]